MKTKLWIINGCLIVQVNKEKRMSYYKEACFKNKLFRNKEVYIYFFISILVQNGYYCKISIPHKKKWQRLDTMIYTK